MHCLSLVSTPVVARNLYALTKKHMKHFFPPFYTLVLVGAHFRADLSIVRDWARGLLTVAAFIQSDTFAVE